MPLTQTDLADYLLDRMREVLEDFEGDHAGPLSPSVRFAEAFDSMAMVEFLEVVADECGCDVAALEQCVGRRFSTVEQLAEAMQAAGLVPTHVLAGVPSRAGSPANSAVAVVEAGVAARDEEFLAEAGFGRGTPEEPTGVVWLAGAAARLPRQVQRAPELDEAVGRPAGWLQRRAGILERRVWGSEDPIVAAADCAAHALNSAGVPRQRLGALLTVSEAPPLSIGLAAAVHHELGLRAATPCFELAGACTGFLSAMALARSLLARTGPVLIVSVESHSKLLPLVLGPRGESAALFGDGCAAVVLGGEPGDGPPVRLIDLATFADGSAGDLLRVEPLDGGGYSVEMEGVPLTEFALHALATATRDMATKHGFGLGQLSAVVAHGGNGRMPAMLARLLRLPQAKVWSDVARTGNLGSASVPFAWASRAESVRGPVIWAAVGAGIVWGGALWDVAAGR